MTSEILAPAVLKKVADFGTETLHLDFQAEEEEVVVEVDEVEVFVSNGRTTELVGLEKVADFPMETVEIKVVTAEVTTEVVTVLVVMVVETVVAMVVAIVVEESATVLETQEIVDLEITVVSAMKLAAMVVATNQTKRLCNEISNME